MKEIAINVKMHELTLSEVMHTRCDVCGKGRGGGEVQRVSHAKCSKIRQARYKQLSEKK